MIAAPGDPAPARVCGSCTACCDGWLQIEVYGHHVGRGQPCPFSTGCSCRIYETRPQDPCRAFVCGWLTATSPMPEWMRPDLAGVILLAANVMWRGLPVDVAVPVGEGIRPEALDWLKSFCAGRRRLLLYQIADDWYAFGPPVFQTEMRERIGRGERPWEG